MPRLIYPLTPAGLSVPCLVGLDGRTTTALRAAGLPIPPPVPLRGLLDTCLDVTAVASGALRQLAIPPATTARTHTAAGVVTVFLYEVSLSILGPAQTGGFLLTHPGLVVSELSVPLPDAEVLIGLDLLLTGQVLIDGPAGQFTMDY